jgi:hypothetical protein
MSELEYDAVARDLVALGRTVDVPTSSVSLATAVLARLPDAPPGRPVAALSRRRWIVVAAAVAVALLALLAAPPVRATVADWFGFGGVRVERGDVESPTTDLTPPAVPPSVSTTEAAAIVDFTVAAPETLGEPDGVEVSGDRRMVAMSWDTDTEGVLRLDEFDAALDYSVLKVAPEVDFVTVNGNTAVWFPGPHEVTLLEPDGTRVTHSARLAGHTLIWMADGATLRLEGDVDLARAVEIAESAVPVG